MKCEFCGKDVKTWFVRDEKWCCEDCKVNWQKKFGEVVTNK